MRAVRTAREVIFTLADSSIIRTRGTRARDAQLVNEFLKGAVANKVVAIQQNLTLWAFLEYRMTRTEVVRI